MRKQHNHEAIRGLAVEVKNGDVNKALRLFKKKVMESGILQELRDREAFEKPTTTRKKAKAAGRARHLKKLRTESLESKKF